MRTKITPDKNTVHLEYTDPRTGERIKRSFTIAWSGGAVRDQDGRQVCRGLDGFGVTLQCEHPRFLPELIRAEYQRLYRSLRTRR